MRFPRDFSYNLYKQPKYDYSSTWLYVFIFNGKNNNENNTLGIPRIFSFKAELCAVYLEQIDFL